MFYRKIFRIIKYPFLLPICLLFALLIFIIQSIVLFRFFNVNYSRLAGTYPIEWYIIDKKNLKSKKNIINFFYAKKIKCVNSFWFLKWKSFIYIFPFHQFFDTIVRILKYFPYNEKFLIPQTPPTYSSFKEWENFKKKIFL